VRKEEAVQYIIDQIVANIDRIIDTSNSDTPVRSIILALNTIIRGAEIRVTPLSFKPASIKQDLPGVYKYFDISTTGIYPSLLSKVVIKIAVPKDWVKMKGVLPQDIVVSRYSAGEWSDLVTSFVGEDKENYLYDANSPGFSVFAARIRSPLAPQVIRPVPTVKPNITSVKPLIIITGNESSEAIMEDVKGKLRQKSEGTDEDMARVLGPELEKPAVSWLVIAACALLALFIIAIAAFVYSKRFVKERVMHKKVGRKRKR
jgi:PGF-pre-PGF domain-containing protein